MSLETEALLDRRRLRRSMSFWRALAVLAAVIAIAVVGVLAGGGMDGGLFQKQQIARVGLTGLITENRSQLRMLRKIARDDKVAAVILYVNSPGGTTTGGEALFEAIRDIAKKKPVVAQFGTIATSAAYIAGLATDHIIARGNTITGSVGVIFQWAEVSELLGKVGVKMNEIKSGPLKAEPSPFHPLGPAGRETTEKMVAESMQWFRGLVSDRRKVDTAAIPGLEQGRIFSGREALGHKLIDDIGGEPEVVRYLVEKRGVQRALKVVDWKPKSEDSLSFLGMAVRGIAQGLGLADMAAGWLGEEAPLAALRMGGLVSVWQPSEK
ncbi:MAG: signal peptide peptidase SppA [Hyphomicrobiaceae bacterium]